MARVEPVSQRKGSIAVRSVFRLIVKVVNGYGDIVSWVQIDWINVIYYWFLFIASSRNSDLMKVSMRGKTITSEKSRAILRFTNLLLKFADGRRCEFSSDGLRVEQEGQKFGHHVELAFSTQQQLTGFIALRKGNDGALYLFN